MRRWFQRRKATDLEYLIRRQRLKSEIEQSRKPEENAVFTTVANDLNALTDEVPTDQDLIVVNKVEAELCLFKPNSPLFPTYLRLREKFYRFDKARSTAWQADLKQLLPDSQTVHKEEVVRQRLRQLTYELFEEAESYNRTANERSRVIRNLNCLGSLILFLLLLSIWLAVDSPPENLLVFPHWLGIALGVGAVGALSSTIGSIGHEKARDEYQSTLIVQMIVRMLLGSVYALVVYTAFSSQYLPIKVPSTPAEQLALLVLLAFVAGFSDRLFGQTVSQFITKGRPSGGKSEGS